jgi:hypothetical protein
LDYRENEANVLKISTAIKESIEAQQEKKTLECKLTGLQKKYEDSTQKAADELSMIMVSS